MPIFDDGALAAWAVVGAHQSETGGKEPGGEITTAVSRHDEGMKLTPIKIGENYRLRDRSPDDDGELRSRARRACR